MDDDATFPEMVAPPTPEPSEEETDIGIDDEIDSVEQVKREKLKQDDVFISTPSSQKIEKIVNDEPPIDEGVPEVQKIKPPKQVKKKRVMTEEQKQKLAEARKKGLETRKRNAELKRQAKLEKQREKEIVKAVRKKRISKLERELNENDDKVDEPPPPKVVEKERVVEKEVVKFTREDIDNAVALGIANYDKQRKLEKQEKKKKREEEERQRKIFNTVSRAINPQEDMWRNCFI
jgi:hypothetical protein